MRSLAVVLTVLLHCCALYESYSLYGYVYNNQWLTVRNRENLYDRSFSRGLSATQETKTVDAEEVRVGIYDTVKVR